MSSSSIQTDSSHPSHRPARPQSLARPWRDAVVYTVWMRSFADSNGDGIGDLVGLTAQLDRLAWLGVDTLWLTPIHPSPNADFGYDVTDYCAVAPEFGTLADFDTLLAEAHRRGMRVVIDLVINHTSCHHPWFRAAEPRTSPTHDWYYWRDTPNDWEAIFGGSAWRWSEVAQQYYLHLFLPEQPDLNWEHPAVRAALAEVARFWLTRGVDGFRFDALTVLKKAPGLPDAQPTPAPTSAAPSAAAETPTPSSAETPPSSSPPVTSSRNPATSDPLPTPRPAWHRFLAQPGLEALFADFVAQSGLTRDYLTLGEANGLPAECAAAWISEPAGLLSALLHFELWHLDTCRPNGAPSLDTQRFSEVCTRWWQTARAAGTVPAIYFENHDLPRVVTAWADDCDPTARRRAAKAFAAALLLQEGIALLYQGQELGLPNARLTGWHQVHDRAAAARVAAWRAAGWSDEAILAELTRSGRDAVRTPYPWDARQPNGGFTRGTPWTPLDPAHLPLAWQQQYEDPDSVLHWYRTLIARRHRRKEPA